jgi:hypothetical protein
VTSPGILDRLSKGETADVVILTKESAQQLMEAGQIAAETDVGRNSTSHCLTAATMKKSASQKDPAIILTILRSPAAFSAYEDCGVVPL